MTTDRIRVIANAYICQVGKILAAIFLEMGTITTFILQLKKM